MHCALQFSTLLVETLGVVLLLPNSTFIVLALCDWTNIEQGVGRGSGWDGGQGVVWYRVTAGTCAVCPVTRESYDEIQQYLL